MFNSSNIYLPLHLDLEIRITRTFKAVSYLLHQVNKLLCINQVADNPCNYSCGCHSSEGSDIFYYLIFYTIIVLAIQFRLLIDICNGSYNCFGN